MRQVGFQESLDSLRSILRFDIAVDVPADLGVRTKTAAGEQMIALDCVVALPDRHLRRQQADIADVVLRTGMMAAREMDVEWHVDVDARLAPVADCRGMT